MTGGHRFTRDASGRLCASFDAQPDFQMFDAIAAFLVKVHHAKVASRASDHLDTRYWDFRIGGQLVTLHVDWACLDLIAAEPSAEETVRALAPAVTALLSRAGPA